MGLIEIKWWWLVLLFCFSIFHTLSASSFISDGVFGSHVSTERKLLQIKQDCPINFENQDYTILTSQCKAPNYSSQPCCTAFREFACPFAESLNNLRNDCSERMFSYLRQYGYPQGLFSGQCNDVKEGISCPAPPPADADALSGTAASSSAGGAGAVCRTVLIAIFISSVVFF